MIKVKSFTSASQTSNYVGCYKRYPTLGVIKILHGRNLLTTLDTPPSHSINCPSYYQCQNLKMGHVTQTTPLSAAHFLCMG